MEDIPRRDPLAGSRCRLVIKPGRLAVCINFSTGVIRGFAHGEAQEALACAPR
jgi:hypothetical protein